MSMITFESSIEFFLNLVLIINIIRIIQCTSLHPRLATLAGTLFKAIDDLWHTSILVVLIVGCFAAVGTWRFGSFRQEFATMSDTISTNLSMMFSASFFDRWDSTFELQVYTVLFLVIVYLLILNFLLAIIVDAFMDIRKHIVELEIEQEFFTDVISMVLSYTLGKYRGWPSSKDLGLVLSQQKAKFNVGFVDLYKTGLFKTPRSVSTFIKFYSQYHFLDPIHITKQKRPPYNKDEKLLMEIRKMNMTFLELKTSLSEVLGTAVLRDEMRSNETGTHELFGTKQRPAVKWGNSLVDAAAVHDNVSATIDSIFDSDHRSSEMFCVSNMHSAADLNSQNNSCGNYQESDIHCNLVFSHVAMVAYDSTHNNAS
jgi:hypothetical protein